MLFVSACVCGLCELSPLYSSYLRSHLFSKPNGRVPLGSTTARRAARTLDGSFATLSSVPSIGTGCIVAAVVDMAGSRVELTWSSRN